MAVVDVMSEYNWIPLVHCQMLWSRKVLPQLPENILVLLDIKCSALMCTAI